jgi:D-glycero-D-manno-heptose 1,7-bisphosphate phosphatase
MRKLLPNKDMDNSVPAVFLDRDGTVCEEVGYLREEEKLSLISGSAQAIRMIIAQGWKPVIISNQSGIARKYMSVEDVDKINKKLQKMLADQNAPVEQIYYCPHHPKGYSPYNIECDCRKPASGLLLKAASEGNLNISQSIMIGDKYSDVQTAHRLNIPGILVQTGFGLREIEKYQNNWEKPPEYIAVDLLDAINWWFNHSQIDFITRVIC